VITRIAAHQQQERIRQEAITAEAKPTSAAVTSAAPATTKIPGTTAPVPVPVQQMGSVHATISTASRAKIKLGEFNARFASHRRRSALTD
jgi:hypothetical protein